MLDQIHEQRLPAQVQPQIEHAAPVGIPSQIAEALLQPLGQPLEPPKSPGNKRRLFVHAQFLAFRRADLGRPIGAIFHLTAEHFREQKAGGQMRGADQRQIPVSVGSKAEAAPSLIEHLFHFPLGLNAAGWMEKESWSKADARLRLPPIGSEHNFHRQNRRQEGTVSFCGPPPPARISPSATKAETDVAGPRAAPLHCSIADACTLSSPRDGQYVLRVAR